MIDAYLTRHELYLTKILAQQMIPAPVIGSALEYSLFPGGKRIRPILVYLTGALFDVPLEQLDVLAAAIELNHCYSLIHDDLPAMDNDDYRRGKLSCHKQYDEATAILVGDGIQALAIEVLLSGLTPLLPAYKILKITQLLVHAIGLSGMVSGQSLDLSELKKSALTEQELNRIHQLKTGRLISACFSMVLATQEHISSSLENNLTEYGQHIGLVFQIQDDYLDYYAPQHHLGKNRSSDKSNQKVTFATLYDRCELERKINVHYEEALRRLAAFGNKAVLLREFTQQLQQRSLLAEVGD